MALSILAWVKEMVEILAANDGYPSVYFGEPRGKCERRSNILDFESRVVLDDLRR